VEWRAQHSVRERAAQGDDAPDDPQGKQQEWVAEIVHQQSAGGKDSGADHVGDHDVGQGKEAELSLESRT
jgi:hypothetical protein